MAEQEEIVHCRNSERLNLEPLMNNIDDGYARNSAWKADDKIRLEAGRATIYLPSIYPTSHTTRREATVSFSGVLSNVVYLRRLS